MTKKMTEKDKQTEDKIFDAATEVFIEKGMDGARMQDIADRAGMNKSLLHYYYRSKDRLFNAVFEMIAMKMLKKFAPVFDANVLFEDKIRFFFREHISFLQKNPRLPAFLLNEINRNPSRIKQFMANIDIESFWMILFTQHKEELKKYHITRENIPQVMTILVAITVFPFAARGLLKEILAKQNLKFDDFLEDRKTFAADFVISALQNMHLSTAEDESKTKNHDEKKRT
ncbi:MAG: TetR/AcrR family transcriptional regulator [Bacteroidales bacterium]|nr:TetR/AcrR family transcriptional regulator [Bacteroidales bacterium]